MSFAFCRTNGIRVVPTIDGRCPCCTEPIDGPDHEVLKPGAGPSRPTLALEADMYRPTSKLVGCISALTVSLVVIIVLRTALALTAPEQAGRPVIGAHSTAAHMTDILALVISVVFALLYVAWLYRSSKNAWALGATRMRFTPGWCVGWNFIPIMNLWKPYQVVKEIWKASTPHISQAWQRQIPSPILGLWWTFVILSFFLSQPVYALSTLVSQPALAICLVLVSVFLALPAPILALMVIREIQDRQSIRTARLLGSLDNADAAS